MQELFIHAFLLFENVLPPRLKLKSLDWKYCFVCTSLTDNDTEKCNFLVINFEERINNSRTYGNVMITHSTNQDLDVKYVPEHSIKDVRI